MRLIRGDPEVLRQVFADARVGEVEITTAEGTARFASIGDALDGYTMMGNRVSKSTNQKHSEERYLF